MFSNVDLEQFYPTPPNIISKMLEGVDFNKALLEPSAGAGHILKAFIAENKPVSADFFNRLSVIGESEKHLFCEVNSDRSKPLEGFATRIAYNFFDIAPRQYFPDYIIMNPPFKNGEEHFLHAYKIAGGAEIICLLNAETLRNPYTQKRELILKIIEDNRGTIEYFTGAFEEAERKTSVDVALIRLKTNGHRPIIDYSDILKKMKDSNAKTSAPQDGLFKNEVEAYDKFQALEDRFNAFVLLSYDFVNLYRQLRDISCEFTEAYKGFSYWIEKAPKESPLKMQEYIVGKMRKACWKHATFNRQFLDMLNSTGREELQKFLDENSNIPFTRDNVISILETIINNKTKLDYTAIEDSFDVMTAYWKDNRIHHEGWKTNDKFYVGKRVVLPFLRAFGDRYNTIKYPIIVDNVWSERVKDIEKSMEIIVGNSHKDFGINKYQDDMQTMIRTEKLDWGQKHESKFFFFRCYKKGTIHLEFKSERLYRVFNFLACKKRNWIPQTMSESEFYAEAPEVFGVEGKDFLSVEYKAPKLDNSLLLDFLEDKGGL